MFTPQYHLPFAHLNFYQVSLPKVVGKVVEEKEKEGREWVTPDYWKENIVQIEDKTKSGALIGL